MFWLRKVVVLMGIVWVWVEIISRLLKRNNNNNMLPQRILWIRSSFNGDCAGGGGDNI